MCKITINTRYLRNAKLSQKVIPTGSQYFCYKHLIISRMVGDGLLVVAIGRRPFVQ